MLLSKNPGRRHPSTSACLDQGVDQPDNFCFLRIGRNCQSNGIFFLFVLLGSEYIYDTESGCVFRPAKVGSTFCHPISVTISLVWLFIVCCSSLHCQNRGLVQRSSDYSNTCWSHVSCCMLLDIFLEETMLMLLGLSRFVCLDI
jgi:hypothetical protein